MYNIKATNQFKKDLKRCKKRGYDIPLLEKVIDALQKTVKCRICTNPTNFPEIILIAGSAI